MHLTSNNEIIHNLKVQYKNRLLRRVNEKTTATEIVKPVSPLNAIRWAVESWNLVIKQRVENYFACCGLHVEAGNDARIIDHLPFEELENLVMQIESHLNQF